MANANRLIMLGAKGGPAIRPGSSMPTSHLLQLDGRTILVDAGLGCSRAIVAQGVALGAVDAVVITHLHSDHLIELGPFLHTAWCAGGMRPITVWGPRGLEEYWRGFTAAMAFDIELRIADEGRSDLRKLVTIRALNETDSFDLGGVTMRALLNRHPPLKESYALRFEGTGGTVVFSGDTAPLPALAAFARGADVLVHEAMLPEGVDAICARVGTRGPALKEHLLRSHSPVAEAGRIAQEAGVGALVLGHLVPGDDPSFGEADWERGARTTWDGPLHVGRDGLIVTFPAERPQGTGD